MNILNIDGLGSSKKAKDAQGRVLSHNATVKDVYDIATQKQTDVHEFYMNQIPPFVARMIQDALMEYGLIKLTDEATQALATVEAPVVSENTGGEEPAPDSSATVPTDSEGRE